MLLRHGEHSIVMVLRQTLTLPVVARLTGGVRDYAPTRTKLLDLHTLRYWRMHLF
ncbi:hypothetical protein BDZ89DRAFT_477303 [Hymenopellis radicata]|nr:hypothetical protein BDZ89DRAFT_477303 [Hymenopellis radicata]